MRAERADSVPAGGVGTYAQETLPGFIEDPYLDIDELVAQVERMDPERMLALSRRKRLVLVSTRVMVDFCAFLGAMSFAYYIRFENSFIVSRFPPESAPGFNEVLLTMVVGFPLLVAFLKISGMYMTNVRIRTLDRLPRIINSVNALAITMLVGLFLFRVEGSFRGYAIFFWFFCILFVFLGRLLLQMTLSIAGVKDVVERNTLLIGSGRVGKCMAIKLKRHPEFGLRPVGFLDDEPLFTEYDEPELRDMMWLGHLDDFENVARRYAIEKVIIGFVKGSHEPLLELVAQCNRMGVECSVLPRLFEVITDEISVREIGGMSMVPLRSKTMSSLSRAIKVVEDYTLAVLGLLIFWPLLIAVAIAIKLDSPGPVFYTQRRVGKNGEQFKFIKFRSMERDADRIRELLESDYGEDNILWKKIDDPRITRVGKWIRRFSIDEAPQVFNVLLGQMSIVGPRPGLPEEIEKYKDWHADRLNVKPGITGLWQVSGRSELPFDEMIKLDYYYIERWSLWLDIKIILRTVNAVLSRKGAY